MKKIKISPSILSADFSQLGTEIKKLEEGGADMIHVDVMDGHFVPNLTIGPPVIKALKNYSTLPFDVHLMISPVHKYIKDYADAGADIITIHPEATDNLEESINLIKKLNKKIGLSLNPDTPINIIKKFLPSIDLVLIMSVYPGFGGQKFIPRVIDKIKELKNIKEKQSIKFDIEVDGGIDFDNSKLVIAAGANILVSGTTIFKNNKGDIKKNIDILSIKGTGKAGRISKGDLMSLVGNIPQPSTRKSTHGLEERVKMTRLRVTIAKRLKEAQNNAAMITTFNVGCVDLSSKRASLILSWIVIISRY